MKETTYGDPGFSRFIRRAFSRNLGLDPSDWEKPVIGICNTESEINRCHAHFGPLVEAVKRGVLMAGGVPLEFPTISLGELYLSPTSMLFRNLAAMDTEEMIRAQPIDGVVLMGGCDKTIPAQLMGAASADTPAIVVSGGPMINGEYEGRTLGACTDCRYYWQEYRAGQIDEAELENINERLAPSDGHCMVMGSASTIAICTEALGMMLPGGAAVPAPYNLRKHVAKASGKQIVELVRAGIKPSDIMTSDAFENAIRLLMAVGGSTNAVIHLTAIAGRLGFKIPLTLYDDISRSTPLLANIRPTGRYQMEEFFHAGGVPRVMKELEDVLHTQCLTVTGKTVEENLRPVTRTESYRDVIRSREDPLYGDGGIVILQGNLAPTGAVIKPKAGTPELLTHTGRAVVFESIADMEQRIDREDLDVRADDILVLRNAGPIGAPGMPEAGMLPIPKKLLARGVRDMVRISDCRMSGTAFGTVVLHVSPESAAGGPLSLIQSGDFIALDVPNRRLDVLLSDVELQRRQREWTPPHYTEKRGYVWMYRRHVLQADEGCDFDFLRGDYEGLDVGQNGKT